MGLVENDHRVVILDVERLSDLLVDQVVVGHEDKVGPSHSILGRVVRTVLPLLSELVNLFDVHRFPRHAKSAILTVLVVGARVDSFLSGLARCIEGKALVHIDGRVHTEVVSRGNQHCPRLED